MTLDRPLRVAIIGAGPAGTYAADILSKAGIPVAIDIIERLPAPFGLVRYGVAPDHTRIKQIIVALANILGRGDIRLLANVNIGTDLSLQDLREHYDAVIFATGAFTDADLNIPGIELEGSFGAADFVSWFDGHPDVPRTWPLNAKEVAIFGVGNVALDVARILAKHPKDLLPTEIPANVLEGLESSPVNSSFPSGHVAAAAAYSSLVIIVFWHTRKAWARLLVIIVSVAIPVVVGLSRMYRGMHFMSDVIAGAVLGIAAVALSWWLIHRAIERNETEEPGMFGQDRTGNLDGADPGGVPSRRDQPLNEPVMRRTGLPMIEIQQDQDRQ